MAKQQGSLIPVERIERAILLVREQKVMLDADLAALYGVATKQLVQAVKRNRERFPGDFAFQLTKQEFAILRSQTVTSSSGWGGRRTPPWAFTEQGVAMLRERLAEPSSRGRQYRDHADVCPPPATSGYARGPVSTPRRTGEEVRPAIRRRVRCDPPANGATDARTRRNGISHLGQAEARFARRWLAALLASSESDALGTPHDRSDVDPQAVIDAWPALPEAI